MHFSALNWEGDARIIPVTTDMVMETIIVTALARGLKAEVSQRIGLNNVKIFAKRDRVLADFAFGYGTYTKCYLNVPVIEVMGLMTPSEAERDTVVTLDLTEVLHRIYAYEAFLDIRGVYQHYEQHRDEHDTPIKMRKPIHKKQRDARKKELLKY